MRLWSIHPKYLDAKGLVALWREGLLAQKVLLGKTKGYRHHPQLVRFRKCAKPAAAVAAYLRYVADEADSRGYCFDRSKLLPRSSRVKLAVARGQIKYEFLWLCKKVKVRDPARFKVLNKAKRVLSHPLFKIVDGPVASWEKGSQ